MRAEWLADGTPREDLCPPRYRRTSRGFFIPWGIGRRDGELLPTQRVLDALPLLPSSGALAGWASAYVQGVSWLDGVDLGTPVPVPVHVGSDTGRSATQVRFVHDVLDEDEIRVVHGIRVTSPARTAFDAVRWARHLVDAVAVLDAMLRFTSLTRSQFDAELERRGGWRGIRQAREAAALADPAVLSIWESRLRVLYVCNAHLPPPLVNPWVFDPTWRLLGRPDLFDPAVAHAIEYDGEHHLDPAQRESDERRQRGFEAAGVVVTRVDRADFASRLSLVDRLRADRLAATCSPTCAQTRVVPAGSTTEIHSHRLPLRIRHLVGAVEPSVA